jgi:hypothetical protein
MIKPTIHLLATCLAIGALVLTAPVGAQPNPANGNGKNNGKPNEKKKDFPDFDKVVTDKFTKVGAGYLTLYKNAKTDQLYASIPKNQLGKEFMLATSITGGNMRGFQWDNWLLRFDKNNKELLVMAPNTFQTSSGELKQVVNATYPDRLISRVRILTKTGGGDPVIDLKGMLQNYPFTSFGGASFSMFGPYFGGGGGRVVKVAKSKVFPNNVEIEFDFISGSPFSMHYSISPLRSSPGYKSRVADQRVGYFLTAQQDFGADRRADTLFDRYINRWHIEKADSSQELSPPKEPIIFYIEDSVPVKYRRWVREGIEMWNEAFEEIGIMDAIEVRQQTASNEFKDLDPEDARYNFFRWITSGRSFAMGPSRVNPRTGEILDADIIFDDALLRWWLDEYDLMVGSLNAETLSPQLRQWIARNPSEHPFWKEIQVNAALDPSISGTPASLQPEWLVQREMLAYQHPEHDHRLCQLGMAMQQHFAFSGLAMLTAANFGPFDNDPEDTEKDGNGESNGEEDSDENGDSDDSEKDDDDSDDDADTDEDSEDDSDEDSDEEGDDDDEEGDDEEEEGKAPNLLKELPEEFLGQMIRMVVAHEVGHTIGLRHNFKASSWKSFDEIINATDPNEPTVGSVMDYIAISIKADGTVPELWTTPVIGPYDKWAIEYGYAIPGTNGYPGDEKKMLKEIAARSSEDGLDFLTDEDMWAPDPRVGVWDIGKEPIEFARNQLELARNIMPLLLDTVVQEDDDYSKARNAYIMLLNEQYRAGFIAARYVGGHYINRDQKSTEEGRPPITVVEAEKQREAFEMLIEHVFAKDAFPIDPKVQQYLAASRWWHQGDYSGFFDPITLPIQDIVLRIQRGIMFQLMNPDTITRLYNSEFRVTADTDLLTLPELMTGLTKAVWSELDDDLTTSGEFTVRQPMIGNLRRNLQREHASELIEFAIRDEDSWYPAIARTLAWQELVTISDKIEAALEADQMDIYTQAHLKETHARIDQALDAEFLINGDQGGFPMIFFMTGMSPEQAGAMMTPGQVPVNPSQFAPVQGQQPTGAQPMGHPMMVPMNHGAPMGASSASPVTPGAGFVPMQQQAPSSYNQQWTAPYHPQNGNAGVAGWPMNAGYQQPPTPYGQ